MLFPFSLQRTVFACALVCVSLSAISAIAQNSRFQKPREWVDITGDFTIEAQLISASKDSVVLLNEETGNEKEIPIGRLSEKDQALSLIHI